MEKEKLIESKPRRGFFVRLFTRDEMISIFELREVLEGLAARHAARNVTDRDIARLRRFFSGYTTRNGIKDFKPYCDEDRGFHSFVTEVGAKEFLKSILQTYNIISFSYQFLSSDGLVRAPDETIGEHLALAVSTGVAMAAKGFPKRNITAVVVWGAGGGTDTCNRIIHAEMSKFLGVNVNVINKTGGVAGSVGMSHAYGKKHDGYTLCGLSESNVTAGVQGGWDKKFDVWDTFIVGGSPDVISVTPDTPYKTLKDLIEAAKKNPGSIKAAASGAGSIHHLNLLAVEKGSGADFNFIPYKGPRPARMPP
jgi:hypothetical protein